MKLSKTACLVNKKIDKHCSKLVGEFLGTDVPLLRGDTYLSLEWGRRTFVEHKGSVSVLGINRYIHRWEIIKRTPCSYVCLYKDTQIICHCCATEECLTYNYTFQTKVTNFPKRFFPHRSPRNFEKQDILNSYAKLPFCKLPPHAKVKYAFKSFFLSTQG